MEFSCEQGKDQDRGPRARLLAATEIEEHSGFLSAVCIGFDQASRSRFRVFDAHVWWFRRQGCASIDRLLSNARPLGGLHFSQRRLHLTRTGVRWRLADARKLEVV